jgi:hypothetical protein
MFPAEKVLPKLHRQGTPNPGRTLPRVRLRCCSELLVLGFMIYDNLQLLCLHD